jgi:hypothetical protein
MTRARGVLAVVAAALTAGLVAVAFSPPATGQTPNQLPSVPPAGGSGNSSSDSQIIAFINAQIKKGWDDNGIKPSEVASDYEFLRRVYLDIIGRIPTLEEISAFQRRPEKTRRAETIQALLKHEDYASNWANLWTVWLLTRTSPPGVHRESMRMWLEQSFAINKPYHVMVAEILTATGKVNETANGAANFIASHVGERTPNDKRVRDGWYEMVPVTSRTTRLFLGLQTQCTQCHDHPFIDERKHHQYWGVNAFFRQVERQPDLIGGNNNQQVGQYYTVRDNLNNNPSGGVFYEKRSGRLDMAWPTYLDGTRLVRETSADDRPGAWVLIRPDGTRVPIKPETTRRQVLTQLILEDEHFAKAIVNRMWGHFFGRGFTNPVDDFGEHNPVSHPELLDRLAQEFAASGYDLRRLITWITNSYPYHLTSKASKGTDKPDDEKYFPRMLLKAMTPEQLVDSIFVATNAEMTKSTNEERRKMYEEWLRDFTLNFGDDEGNEATFNGTVVQALMLLNGPRLNEAVKNRPGSTVNRVMAAPPPQRLRILYLVALTREPTAAEVNLARTLTATGAKDPSIPYQDILWALLNSNEFILNH